MKYENITIERLNHSCFLIKGSKVIYTDPFKIPGGEKADIILVSHSHFDHCSQADIDKISKDSTIIVAPAECELPGKTIRPNEKINADNVAIEAVPAYNTNKAFHPKADGKVGFVFTLDGKRIYHAGDTDFIPEMKNLKNIDIAFLPVSGTYVMTADEAAAAAEAIKPKLAIPMHYAAIIGSKSDAERFRDLLKGKINVEIL